MQNLMEALGQELAQGRPAMLCTILESRGSAPRGAGAKMLLMQSGKFLGTIGGGIMEHLVLERAKEVLKTGCSLTESFNLNANASASIGMICGGSVRVFLQYCSPAWAEFFCTVAAYMEKDQDVWLVTRAEENWICGLYDQAGQLLCGQPCPVGALSHLGKTPFLLETPEEAPVLVDPLSLSGYVYIFGGGHISQALVPVLAQVDFRPVIFEDRPEFARPELFPGAAGVYLGDFFNFGKTITVRRQDYIAIMTRGHMADHEVLEQALRTPARYLGLIGSRSKMAITRQKLLDAGFTEADIRRIHNPIGLPILAETPAEIAISIAAEMIRHRAEGAQE